ncbi:MAG: hypothetical protein ABJI69_05080 [Balneola sp.]
MSSSFSVKASIFNIRESSPKERDRFLVDTNVWYYLLFPQELIPPDGIGGYQLHFYPEFLAKAKKCGATLYFSSISLVELFRLVESTSYRFYVYKNGLDTENFSRKDFRYSAENGWQGVLDNYDAIYSNIKDWANHLPRNEHDDLAYLNNLHDNLTKGYLELGDQIMIKAMKKSKFISQIITDDGDFATCKDIEVYTANNSVIKANKKS